IGCWRHLEHDPEKACPGLDPGSAAVFGQDHAQTIGWIEMTIRRKVIPIYVFFSSIGTMAASLELRSVSEVLTLRTCGAPVSSATKAWNVLRSGATHFSTKSISPDSIQHSRTSGSLRTKFSNALRSASAWLDRWTMAKTVTS